MSFAFFPFPSVLVSISPCVSPLPMRFAILPFSNIVVFRRCFAFEFRWLAAFRFWYGCCRRCVFLTNSAEEFIICVVEVFESCSAFRLTLFWATVPLRMATGFATRTTFTSYMTRVANAPNVRWVMVGTTLEQQGHNRQDHECKCVTLVHLSRNKQRNV